MRPDTASHLSVRAVWPHTLRSRSQRCGCFCRSSWWRRRSRTDPCEPSGDGSQSALSDGLTAFTFIVPSAERRHRCTSLSGISSASRFVRCTPCTCTYRHTHSHVKATFPWVSPACAADIYRTFLSWQATATCVLDESRSMSYSFVFSTM